MQTSRSTINNTFAFQLKGSLLTLTVLQLLLPDIESFAAQLEAMIQKTPNFFKNAPIIIDLEKLSDYYDTIDFTQMKTMMCQFGMIPVGVRNCNPTQTAAAVAAGLGILSATTQPDLSKAQITTAPAKGNSTKLITHPVRSGQQIYAQNSDLIVIAPVSAGAELLADGHIHIYGTLRGRAIAGVNGDLTARIFCHRLAAELISIAGYYKLSDDIKAPPQENGLQIFLEEEKLRISPIS